MNKNKIIYAGIFLPKKTYYKLTSSTSGLNGLVKTKELFPGMSLAEKNASTPGIF